MFRLQCVVDSFEMYKTTRSINRRIAIQTNLAVDWAALVLCPESSDSNFGRRPATPAQFYWFSSLRTAKFDTRHNRTRLHSCTALFTNHRAIWHCTIWATDTVIQTELTLALLVLHTTADMFVRYFHNSTISFRAISRVRFQSFGDPSVTIIRIDTAGPKHKILTQLWRCCGPRILCYVCVLEALKSYMIFIILSPHLSGKWLSTLQCRYAFISDYVHWFF